eukprot:TRINITY_DN6627_c0_g4_i3.p1 TRINITY_DN6627_c0_g4~~TRINITY_DN6627_c0_g4_i3.p1  ORF type:complete len:456 (+),score=147.31 TRINITY_DN6627_c0_g4_i3:147-1370(+)
MRLLVRNFSTGKETAIEVDENSIVETVKTVLEIETDVPAAVQLIVHNGRYIQDEPTKSLKYFGIKAGSKITIVNQIELQQNNAQALKLEAQMLIDYYKSNMMLLDELLARDRPLAEAVVNEDMGYVENYVMAQKQKQLLSRMQENAEIQRLREDIMNPESQRKIEEIIKRQRINENLRYAEEEMPESFIKVPMLYIDCSVNGIPMQAFIDTGAQSTIMSQNCAKKLQLLKMMDDRYKGIATGVGTGKIIGRVHAAQMEIGGRFFPFAITVIESATLNVDMILGLDNLKRHRCVIDLAAGCLKLMNGELSVPFISEKDVRESYYSEQGEIAAESLREESKGGKPSPAKSAAAAQPKPAAAPVQSENEKKIARLVQEGISRQEATSILANVDWNLDMALMYVIQMKSGL